MKSIVFVEFLKSGKSVAYFVGTSWQVVVNDAKEIGIKFDAASLVDEQYIRSLPNLQFVEEGISSVKEGRAKSFAFKILK